MRAGSRANPFPSVTVTSQHAEQPWNTKTDKPARTSTQTALALGALPRRPPKGTQFCIVYHMYEELRKSSSPASIFEPKILAVRWGYYVTLAT